MEWGDTLTSIQRNIWYFALAVVVVGAIGIYALNLGAQAHLMALQQR